MASVAGQFLDWGLVYLGGQLSTNLQGERLRQIDDSVVSTGQVYQTHAFVIRRAATPEVLRLLLKGHAPDAALGSWSRSRGDACFLFHPRQLLQQPGRASRWKDSDSFKEGEAFKRKGFARDGEYNFNPHQCVVKV